MFRRWKPSENWSLRRSRISIEQMKIGRSGRPAQVARQRQRSDRAETTIRRCARYSTAISKASGINFLYDDQAQLEKRITVDLSGVNMERAMDTLMLQSGNFYKVVDETPSLWCRTTRTASGNTKSRSSRPSIFQCGRQESFGWCRWWIPSAPRKDLNSITIRDAPEEVAVIGKIIGPWTSQG